MLEILRNELVHVLAVMDLLNDIDPESSAWDDMKAQVEQLQRRIAVLERSKIPRRRLH